MRASSLTLLLVLVVFVPNHQVIAQSPEMPEPLAIVVDADGKPMVQVFDIESTGPLVLFDFDGVPAVFRANLQGGAFSSGHKIYFSEDNCMGSVYFTPGSYFTALEESAQQVTEIAGPFAVLGTYRVFRSTSMNTVQAVVESGWINAYQYEECIDYQGFLIDLLPAEEIHPNPLEGFHGPTLSNPERMLTVKGGTRLP